MGSQSISLKYDPMGNRVLRTANGTTRKYIVDITGELPVILMDLNLTNSSLKNKYMYADRQILAQHDIDDDAQPAQDDRYFYLHDRLGSVRLVIDHYGAVQNYYTYEPFGQTIESGGTLDNPFRFTGQYFDSEIEEYYLRARQYNPQIARFTARDPIDGEFGQPLTLHKYLYCVNNPINRVDPTGLSSALSQALSVAIAANVRASGYEASLSLPNSLLDQVMFLGMIDSLVSTYVSTPEEKRIDYRSGPEAFRHLGLTQQDLHRWGTETGAVLMAQMRIATEASLAAGKYYFAGYGLTTVGLVLNAVGGKILYDGGHPVAGGIIAGVGGLIDVGGVWSLRQAQKITTNAKAAAEMYCDPENLIR